MSTSILHNIIFTFYVYLFKKSKTDHQKLIVLDGLGKFLTKNFIGIFRIGEFEDYLQQTSYAHFRDYSFLKPKNNNSIVHVVTRTYTTGGHSRFLENLIQLDKKNLHHLIVLDQSIIEPRNEINNLIKDQNGKIKWVKEADTFKKCQILLDFIVENGGKIMLHHHPDDYSPSIALAVLKENYEIILFNHADHLFSFGFELNPKVINIREEAHRMTYHLRKVKNSHVLPLPIIKESIDIIEISEIKKELSIKPDQIIGLCIGSKYKFKRTEKYNFFKVINDALSENENLVVLIIGPNENELSSGEFDYLPNERLIILGQVNNPSKYQAIADIAIDPIPYGSYTALLETCYYGAQPLTSIYTTKLFEVYSDPAFEGLYSPDFNNEEYLKSLKNRVKNSSKKTKLAIHQRIVDSHAGDKWLSKFFNILECNVDSAHVSIPDDNLGLKFMNQEESEIKFATLNWMYDNSIHFNLKTVSMSLIYLLKNNFNSRELMGIFKKRIKFSLK